MTVVDKVPQNHVARVWPHVEEFVASVAPWADGEWTVDQIKADVLTGRLSLIVFANDDRCIGAIIYSMQNRRNSRTAFILVCGGEGITTQGNWEQVKAIFTNEGATTVEAAMRPSVLRLWSQLGFKEKYRITGVDL